KLNDLDSTKLIKISDMRNFPNILSTQINSANRLLTFVMFRLIATEDLSTHTRKEWSISKTKKYGQD
ncbi:MAG: hypothetical protein SOY65_04635, partial [Marinifilaceae bacterium]|nr:hypothetical protein [Marinifilaceae bacterium]